MSREYVCAMCGEECETDTPVEEEITEMESFFGAIPESERVSVCDDCWQIIHPEKHPERVRAAIAETKGDA